MICIPIVGPRLSDIERQIQEATPLADLLELRFDLFERCTPEEIQRSHLCIPFIATLRSESQGGGFKGSQEEYQRQLLSILEINPSWIDIEYGTPTKWIEEISKNFPHVRIILSYHDFQQTPSHLETLIQEMQTCPAALYKIACKAHSILDACRMLTCISRFKQLLGISMGERGEITRILGTLFGNPWTFATIQEGVHATAEGQISVSNLIEIYGFKGLNQNTQIFGLIGFPLLNSVSHLIHNRVLRRLSLNALYLKLPLTPEELPLFIEWARKNRFSGLSVTIPLKESILPPSAVNTVHFRGDKLFGYNTDGIGCLNALEKHLSVNRKRIVILGAGGSAKGIIPEALARGAHLTVLNRTLSKAGFPLSIRPLDDLKDLEYDILINTLPEVPDSVLYAICPSTVVMDIRIPYTPFLETAKKLGCTVVFGYEMFIYQALEQLKIWFPHIK